MQLISNDLGFATRTLLAFKYLAEVVCAQSTTPVLSHSQISRTSFSYISGPKLDGWGHKWTKILTPVTVGTVVITVDEAAAQVSSRTIYHDEYTNHANMSLFSPTGIDVAVTKVQSVLRPGGIDFYLTYPTNYFEFNERFDSVAVVPITATGTYAQLPSDTQLFLGPYYTISDLGSEGTCCFASWINQPTPAHEPLTQDQVALDRDDPYGFLYKLTFVKTELGSAQISALWSNMPQSSPYTGCPHPLCISSSIADANQYHFPVGVQDVASILATTTPVLGILATMTTTLSREIASLASAPPSVLSIPSATATSTTSIPASNGVRPTPTSSSHNPGNGSTDAQDSTRSSHDADLIVSSSSNTPTVSSVNPASSEGSAGSVGSTVFEASSSDRSDFVSQITLPAVAPVTSKGTLSGMTLIELVTPFHVLSGQTIYPGMPVTIESGSSVAVLSLSTEGSDLLENPSAQRTPVSVKSNVRSSSPAPATTSVKTSSQSSTSQGTSSGSVLGALITQGLAVGALIPSATTSSIAMAYKSSARTPVPAPDPMLGILIALGAIAAALMYLSFL